MLDELVKETLKEVQKDYKKIDEICMRNSLKILNAFHKERILATDFAGTTGYGYGDIGRLKLERVYADIFKCEKALVRSQFISGTHALTVALFALLRPKDKVLFISGKPYDTLLKVVGIVSNESSLKSYGIDYEIIKLKNNDFDYEKIKEKLNVKVVYIQRSIGYSKRNTLSIEQIKKVIKFIKEINKDIIVLVDNCYCELCTSTEPTEVGADVVVGSLIKNLGGGISPLGAYICGKEKYVDLCANRLTSPGLGDEVGATLGLNKAFLQGLYMAPSAVASSLKLKVFTKVLCNKIGLSTINNELDDIVLGIVFESKDKQVKYVQEIQKNSAIDSSFVPAASDMPGYDHQIIMASGSFIDGSSIELSCDGPIKEPYIAYQQGTLTYEYGVIAVINAIKESWFKNDRENS